MIRVMPQVGNHTATFGNLDMKGHHIYYRPADTMPTRLISRQGILQ